MPDEMRLLREPFIAILAQERLLTGVHQHVLVQLPFRRESLPALFTPIVLLSGMYLYVRVQIARAGKPLRAIGATVRSL